MTREEIIERIKILLRMQRGGTEGIIVGRRTGREFIGIEPDPEHFANAVKRIRREEAQAGLL